jgi:MOSC domain-containing protein YiiM
MSGKVYRISISDSKGKKKRNVPLAKVIEHLGIEGDAHAGTDRQISLLAYESFSQITSNLPDIRPGDFAENITTTGIALPYATVGGILRIGREILLQVTQIGKECHNGCHIRKIVGDCIMPREGVFARVLRGGTIAVGDTIEWSD